MELGDVDDQDKLTRAPENVITKGEDKDKEKCGGPSNQCRHYGRVSRLSHTSTLTPHWPHPSPLIHLALHPTILHPTIFVLSVSQTIPGSDLARPPGENRQYRYGLERERA
jgi:hypothetical protein